MPAINQDQLPFLVTFASVVEAGSFVGGAERLAMAPSVVSKHIAKLEKSLGTRLLNRSTRSQSLTEAGAVFYEHCRRIVDELAESEQAIATLQSEPVGLLRIATLPSVANTMLAPMLPDYMARHPAVELEIVTGQRNVNLAEEGFDLALRLTRDPTPTLVARRLAPIHFKVCGAPDYFRRHGVPRTPAEVASHTCFGYAGVMTPDRWRFFDQSGVEEVEIRCKLLINSIDAVRSLVLAGAGLAMLPTFVVAEDLRTGRVEVALEQYDGIADASLYAIHRPNRYGSPKLRSFIEFLLDRIGDPPYWERWLAEASSKSGGA